MALLIKLAEAALVTCWLDAREGIGRLGDRKTTKAFATRQRNDPWMLCVYKWDMNQCKGISSLLLQKPRIIA